MAKTRFTDLGIRSFSEGIYFDERTPAFGLRVGKNRKTWLIVKNGTKVRLGHYPALSLADARKKALVALGSPLASPSAPTFPEARAEFLAHGKWRDNSRKQITRQLMRFNFTKPLDHITHQDIAHELAQITKPSDAWHAHKDLRAFFNSCVPRYLKNSPVNGIKPPSRYVPRERVLTNDEIKKIWHATDPQDVYGATIRLLFLLGTRLTETSLLRPQWIDGHKLTIPADITKNARTLIIPIPSQAIPLIHVLRHFKNWQHHKPSLDKASGVYNWTHHDIRRTFCTLHQRIGTPLPVIEALVNHTSGTRAGIAGIYNRWNYLPEAVLAVAAYEQFLLKLIASREP